MLIVFRRVLKKKSVCVWGVIKEERNHLPGVCDGWGSTRWVCRAGGLKGSLGTAEGGMGLLTVGVCCILRKVLPGQTPLLGMAQNLFR